MKSRRVLTIIFLLTILGLWIDWPRQTAVHFNFKQVRINWRFQKPKLAFSLAGKHFSLPEKLPKGLDLAGGVHLVFQAKMGKIPPKDRRAAWQALEENIHHRVDAFGLGEVAIRRVREGNNYRLTVDIPGDVNPQQAVALIGKTAQLDFRLVAPVATVSAKGKQVIFQQTGLTGAYLQGARVEFNRQTGKPYIGLMFNAAGAKKFAEITRQHVGQRLAVFLDKRLLMAPEIKEPILNGQAMVSGNFQLKEAKEIVSQLNAGALPVPLDLIEQQRVSPTLGKESVQRAFRAGAAGVIIESLFMLLVYGWLGFLALLGLAVYGILSFMLYKILPVTLTMPGIAGFLLSLGMAVDANILIFERMKEELRSGKPWRLAMELGFGRAWDSIRDANACTLITSFVLFNPFDWHFLNTAGMVRGFALTLGLGVLLELFTSIIVVRAIMRVLYHRRER